MLGNIIQVLNHPKTLSKMDNIPYLSYLASNDKYATYKIVRLPTKLTFMPEEELQENLQNGNAYAMIVESLTSMGIAHNLFPQALDQSIHITRFTSEGAVNIPTTFSNYLYMKNNDIPLPSEVTTVQDLEINQDQIKLGNLYLITSLGEH